MSETPAETSPRGATTIVALLALFAAARIFFGAAALPLFTNVDEQAHYDLVHKFAERGWPGAGEQRFDVETARTIALYGSPEYLTPREQAAARPAMKPMWMAPRVVRDAWLPQSMAPWTTSANHEAHSPPVYYGIAAAWSHVGRLAGLEGGSLIYWIRFLNVPLYAALVVLSYRFVARFYPGQTSLRFAVPVLLAAFPQDVFFAINNDVASPLFFLGALFLLLAWRDEPTPGRAVAAGVGVALTFLVKTSNVAILAAFAVILVGRAIRVARAGELRRHAGGLSLLTAVAAGPIVAWLVRNAVVLGDPTGSADKARMLDWTVKPLGEWLNHPLFTPSGLGFFAYNLNRHFWRGETLWHLDPVVPPAVDAFFLACTVVLIVAAAIRWGRDRAGPDGVLLVAVGASVLFLAALSLVFDFGACWYPSRERPFFVAGRLMLGALVPFVILLVRGLEWLTARAPAGGRYAALAAIVGVSLFARYGLLAAAWPSEFNWFHLP